MIWLIGGLMLLGVLALFAILVALVGGASVSDRLVEKAREL